KIRNLQLSIWEQISLQSLIHIINTIAMDMRVKDEKVDKILVDMRSHDPEDKEGYLKDWLEFQKWYNDYLPNIPLYSNKIHSGFTSRVEGYDATPSWGIGSNINYMNLK